MCWTGSTTSGRSVESCSILPADARRNASMRSGRALGVGSLTTAGTIRELAMQVSPYLSFKGETPEAAFTLYAKCLGGEAGRIFRYGGSPMADQAPAGWQDKVMHGSVTIGTADVDGRRRRARPLRGTDRLLPLDSDQRHRPRPSASFTSWPRAAGCRCRSRRRSGPSVSAC